jgi:hypothetical protein
LQQYRHLADSFLNVRFAPEAVVDAREQTLRVCPVDTAIASARHLGRIEIFVKL